MMTYKYLNYVANLLILSSAITACVSVSEFALLVRVSACITSSALEIEVCAITAKTKRSILQKNKKKHVK